MESLSRLCDHARTPAGDFKTRERTILRLAAILAGALVMTACRDNAATAPSRTALVTFNVQGETFRVLLTSADQLVAARAAQSGGPARIPTARIVAGTEVNIGWTWHLEDLSFTEATIEVCDGRPSDVERQGTQFGEGRFCPWTAVIVRIDDRSSEARQQPSLRITKGVASGWASPVDVWTLTRRA